MRVRPRLTVVVLLLALAVPGAGAAGPVRPEDFTYIGAFRLPGGDDRPATFAYGGNAMTFNPEGDPSGLADGFPGSLFITGHDRLPYGELPDGGQVAEVAIPVPTLSTDIGGLDRAPFLKEFMNVLGGRFGNMDEIPRLGLTWLKTRATGAKVHVTWGSHLKPEGPAATQAWFSPNLRAASVRGPWFIGRRPFYAVGGYLFEIPEDWARANSGGRILATGRFRDGGWSGMGPALFAYRPWIDRRGTPAPPGSRLRNVALLQYESSQGTEAIGNCLDGYQHPDEWEGGAWLTTSTGKSAVLFAGTKGTGGKYWYGFVNPVGPDVPCVAEDFVGQFDVCRLADGAPCPPEDLGGCQGHNDYRGWWSSRFEARFILYDPDDLARVASGELAAWAPQPYGRVDLDRHLFLNPSAVETAMLGTGVQRRFRLGDVAYDRAHDLLYVLELFADGAKPVVHVWRVR